MAQLSSLSPKLIWQFFEQICSIPTLQARSPAERLDRGVGPGEGLAVKQDAVGNIIIKETGHAGMENRKAVVLQAHRHGAPGQRRHPARLHHRSPSMPTSMANGVTARGTTLGADNGMGMAGCLAVLADKTIKHGPLEVLLTTDRRDRR